MTPWTAGRQASLSITSSSSLLKFMSIESVMPSNHLTLSHLLHSHTLYLAILCIPLSPAERLFRSLSLVFLGSVLSSLLFHLHSTPVINYCLLVVPVLIPSPLQSLFLLALCLGHASIQLLSTLHLHPAADCTGENLHSHSDESHFIFMIPELSGCVELAVLLCCQDSLNLLLL